MTLYLKIGGRPAFKEAMTRLEDRLSSDGSFGFAEQGGKLSNTDDLCEFLIFLSGGAPFYDGSPVAEILGPLRLSDARYDLFVDHLVDVLTGDLRSIRAETELRLVMEHVRPHVVSPPPRRPNIPPDTSAGVYAP